MLQFIKSILCDLNLKEQARENSNDLIWTNFIVYNTNGSDASSDNLPGLHHKNSNIHAYYIYF